MTILVKTYFIDGFQPEGPLKSTTLRLTGRCITSVEKSLEAIELSTTCQSRGQKEHESPIQLFTSAFGFGKKLIYSPLTNHDILFDLVQ